MKSDDTELYIQLTRRFAAAPERVFAEWLNAEALKDWFAPETFTGVSARAEPKVGGAWQVDYKSANGETFSESGRYLEIMPGKKLVMTLVQSVGAAPVELRIEVLFEPDNGGTVMHFRQSGFFSVAQRDAIREGWAGCLAKLSSRLGDAVSPAEVDLLAVFDAWFDASERKDLDASMAPIADDIVSYEHSAPLEVRDIEQLRAECKAGFDQASDEFRWDIPDLRIIVRGDIAITWGLNRIADYEAGKLKSEMWSRGTRVFQHRDGRWQMIHQHVSFPMDPQTGVARTDLKPR